MTGELELYRSLIHKVIRRGDMEMTRRAIFSLIREQDFDWLGKRLAVLTFEECWTYGTRVTYDANSLSDHLLQLAGTVKNKNAAGLGSLAYNLSLGDESVIQTTGSEKELRFISEAIAQPVNFWEWTEVKSSKDYQKVLIANAMKGFEYADQPWDKSFMLASAFLAVASEIPETKFADATPSKDFPLWIVIDMHTSKGIAAISEASRKINIDPVKAMWLAFYFEGALCNELMPSPWWEQEKIWRLKKLGLTLEEGRQGYERLKPILREVLKEEEERLREAVFGL